MPAVDRDEPCYTSIPRAPVSVPVAPTGGRRRHLGATPGPHAGRGSRDRIGACAAKRERGGTGAADVSTTRTHYCARHTLSLRPHCHRFTAHGAGKGRSRRPLAGILGDSGPVPTGPAGSPLRRGPVAARDPRAPTARGPLRRPAIVPRRTAGGEFGVPGLRTGREWDLPSEPGTIVVPSARVAPGLVAWADPGQGSNSWAAGAAQPLLVVFLSSSFIILFRGAAATPFRTVREHALRETRGTAGGTVRDRRGRRGGPRRGTSGTMWGRAGTQTGNVRDSDSPLPVRCGEH